MELDYIEINKYIQELKDDGCAVQKKDSRDMSGILLYLKNGNYNIASRLYSNMDTNVRDDFIDKMTNNCKDKEKMRFLSEKLKFDWIGETKKFLEENESIKIEKNTQNAIVGELLTQEKYKFSPDGIVGEVARDVFKLLEDGLK